jgi:hypothetical protein
VTVMVFDSPASGLLWPILRTSNSGALASLPEPLPLPLPDPSSPDSGAWRRVVSLCQSTARAMRVRSLCVCVCVSLKKEVGECVDGRGGIETALLFSCTCAFARVGVSAGVRRTNEQACLPCACKCVCAPSPVHMRGSGHR